MPSLDNVYDILDLLKKDNIEFCVIALRSGKTKDKAEMFYNLKDKTSAKVMSVVLDELKKVINKEFK